MQEKDKEKQMNTEQLLEYISTLPITKSVTLKEYYKMNKKKNNYFFIFLLYLICNNQTNVFIFLSGIR